MARVKVQTAAPLMILDRIARECKGEFFGTTAPCTVQFGFAHKSHARLFQKRVERQLAVYTELYQ